MKRQIFVWSGRILVVVLLALALKYWAIPAYKNYFAEEEKDVVVPSTKVEKGKFTVSFHEVGTVEAENSVPVQSQIEGKIIELVEDGIYIRPGEVIAVLDTTKIEQSISTQELAYQNEVANVKRQESELEMLKESNKTDLEKAEADLAFNESELKRARKNLEKSKELLAEQLIPASEVEQAEIEVKTKELAVDKGNKDLELKKKEVKTKEEQKKADIANATYQRDLKKEELERTKRQLQDAVIRSPASGMVVLARFWDGSDRRKFAEGDNLWPNRQVCTIPDLSSMLANVRINESDAPKIEKGTPVNIVLEAIPDRSIKGKVKDISTLATELRPWQGGTPGQKTFDVTVSLSESDPQSIKPGMSADVEFVLDVIDDAVYVPIEAVFEIDQKTWSYTKNGKKFKRVEVKTGKRNENHVVIEKGLSEGQEIALVDPFLAREDERADKKEENDTAPVPEKED